MTLYGALGTLCLGALWSTALLVAAAAWSERRALRSLLPGLRPLRPGESGIGLVEGEIAEALGADGSLASHAIEAIGRALDGVSAAVVLRDRRWTSRVSGGVVRVGGQSLVVEPCAERASVWTSRRAKQAASACPAGAAFDAACTAARTPTGAVRTLVTALRPGDCVFVCGEVLRDGDVSLVRAPRQGALLVAAEDPRVFVARASRIVEVFVAVEIVACALCTALAMAPPAFGPRSTLGGVLCLAFFLGVTPIGVWVRDRCRTPDRMRLHVVWTQADATAPAS